jgi:pimeloyl-ACP methyl ester carboxylesterase
VGRSAAQFYRDRIALSESGDAQGFARALLSDTRAAITNPDVDAENIAEQRLRAVGDGAGYRNASAAMAKLNEDPLTPRLRLISQHVRVVGGDNDSFCPRKAADIMLEALPDAKYVEIAGTGHLMNVDQTDAVTQVVRDRLAEAYSAQAA